MGPGGPSSIGEVYKLEDSGEEPTVLVGVGSPEEAVKAAPGVRAAKSFESRKKLDSSIS